MDVTSISASVAVSISASCRSSGHTHLLVSQLFTHSLCLSLSLACSFRLTSSPSLLSPFLLLITSTVT